jgi:hypothetical protein
VDFIAELVSSRGPCLTTRTTSYQSTAGEAVQSLLDKIKQIAEIAEVVP